MVLDILSVAWVICIIALIVYTRKRTKSIRDNQSNKAKAFITTTVIIISIIELLVAYLSVKQIISKDIAILLFCLLPICITILSYLIYYISKNNKEQ